MVDGRKDTSNNRGSFEGDLCIYPSVTWSFKSNRLPRRKKWRREWWSWTSRRLKWFSNHLLTRLARVPEISLNMLTVETKIHSSTLSILIFDIRQNIDTLSGVPLSLGIYIMQDQKASRDPALDFFFGWDHVSGNRRSEGRKRKEYVESWGRVHLKLWCTAIWMGSMEKMSVAQPTWTRIVWN
jgi:hypothetical protein